MIQPARRTDGGTRKERGGPGCFPAAPSFRSRSPSGLPGLRFLHGFKSGGRRRPCSWGRRRRPPPSGRERSPFRPRFCGVPRSSRMARILSVAMAAGSDRTLSRGRFHDRPHPGVRPSGRPEWLRLAGYVCTMSGTTAFSSLIRPSGLHALLLQMSLFSFCRPMTRAATLSLSPHHHLGLGTPPFAAFGRTGPGSSEQPVQRAGNLFLVGVTSTGCVARYSTAVLRWLASTASRSATKKPPVKHVTALVRRQNRNNFSASARTP